MPPERVTVLVADDHPLFRDGIARAVKERPDLELVGEAADGRGALEQIRALAPAVAVVDLRLPGLDGLEVLNAVRRDGLPTRILMLSASTEGPLVFEAIAAGAAGYLSKQADRTAVCDAVAAIARGETVPQGGDAIVAVDGKPVTTSAALADAVAARKPGDRITLGIVRAGQHRDLQVTVGTAPASGLAS